MDLLVDENSALARTNLRALLLDPSVWNILSEEQISEIYQYWPREPGSRPPGASAAPAPAPAAETTGPPPTNGGDSDRQQHAKNDGADGGPEHHLPLLPSLLAQLASNNHLRHDIAEYQTALGSGKHDAEWIRQAQAAHVLRADQEGEPEDEKQQQQQKQPSAEREEPSEEGNANQH